MSYQRKIQQTTQFKENESSFEIDSSTFQKCFNNSSSVQDSQIAKDTFLNQFIDEQQRNELYEKDLVSILIQRDEKIVNANCVKLAEEEPLEQLPMDQEQYYASLSKLLYGSKPKESHQLSKMFDKFKKLLDELNKLWKEILSSLKIKNFVNVQVKQIPAIFAKKNENCQFNFNFIMSPQQLNQGLIKLIFKIIVIKVKMPIITKRSSNSSLKESKRFPSPIESNKRSPYQSPQQRKVYPKLKPIERSPSKRTIALATETETQPEKLCHRVSYFILQIRTLIVQIIAQTLN